MNSRVLSMIGIARKAGKAISGEFLCDKAIKDGSSKFIIIAADASAGTKKSIRNACEYYGVDWIEYSDMDNLGRFTGGGDRAVVSINDDNFAISIKKKYADETGSTMP